MVKICLKIGGVMVFSEIVMYAVGAGLLFLAFVIGLRHYLKARQEACVLVVREYSGAYLDLVDKRDTLLEQAECVPSDAILSVSRSSLQGFRSYIPYKDVKRYASEKAGSNYLPALLEALEFNLVLASEFKAFKSCLDMSESENDWRDACSKIRMPYRKWAEIERELIAGVKLDIRTDWKLRVRLSYVSPAGRSRHYDSWSFSAYDILCMGETEADKQTFRSVERSKMTAKLRYQVLREDGFKCQICGRGVADGETLQVDHIIPVSKGGRTVRENLRTLCHTCNQGKKDRYVWGELN